MIQAAYRKQDMRDQRSIDMGNSIEQIENLFRKADFSKETDLKQRLDRQLFSVRKVTLDELMKAEGMKPHAADKKRKGRARASEKTMDKTAGNESLGALEKDNPLIKKGKPPVM